MKKKAQEKLAAKANPVPVEEVVVPEATATEEVVEVVAETVAEASAEAATTDVAVETEAAAE
ncbi:unannotated protein [freshwater metagenome]|uniref:Unannotated protein n=1 Tax=freshwater metagenome TaxID=449393 RepID=A0A6J5YJI1_9ZZZZ